MPSRKDAVYNPESAKGIKKSYQERDFLQKLILKLFGSDDEEENVEETVTPTPSPVEEKKESSDKISGALKRLIKNKRGN